MNSYLNRFAQTMESAVPPPFNGRQDLSNPPVFGYSDTETAAMVRNGSLPWELDEYRDTWPSLTEVNAKTVRMTPSASIVPVRNGPPKDYLTVENARNKAKAQLFANIIHRAYGVTDDVTIGHHLSFQPHGDIQDLNEIPSADTLIFDHDLMTNVFGASAVSVMQRLAAIASSDRDAELERLFSNL